jgi:hypothetical protein
MSYECCIIILREERSFGERNIIDTSRIAVITMMNALYRIRHYCNCLILMFVWYNKYANNFAEYIRRQVTSQACSIAKMIFRQYRKQFCLKVLKLVFSVSCAWTRVSKIILIGFSVWCEKHEWWMICWEREYYHNCNIWFYVRWQLLSRLVLNFQERKRTEFNFVRVCKVTLHFSGDESGKISRLMFM